MRREKIQIKFNEDGFIEYIGKKKGPTSIILVGVHGNEVCGIKALEKLLPSFQIERGRVLIGYGNPRAIKKGIRYVEENLNRMFRPNNKLSIKEKQSYEYSRAQILKKYLNQSSALLDIHSSNTPQSRPFIICEKLGRKITKYLSIGLVVYGFDHVEPGGTDYYMNQNNKIGICVECGYTKGKKAIDIATKSILAFLASRKHINKTLRIYKQTFIQMYKLYKTEKDFTLSKQFEDFENISRGQIIGRDGKKEISVKQYSVILFARNSNKSDQEAFLLGELL